MDTTLTKCTGLALLQNGTVIFWESTPDNQIYEEYPINAIDISYTVNGPLVLLENREIYWLKPCKGDSEYCGNFELLVGES